MYQIVDFIFRNIFLVVIALIIYYVFRQYKWLKEKQVKINEKFDRYLNKYLSTKIAECKQVVDYLNNLYQVEEVRLELEKINVVINKGMTGTVNEKVETSNTINKYKLAKNLDLEKYPELIRLNKIGTFTEEDMQSLDNGVALARREYNALAFAYNEKASGFPLQYLTKFLRLNQSYVIFDPPKSKAYEEKYEVFEEKEPQVNSITTLNQGQIQQPNNQTEQQPQEPPKN